jgi:hypothetical protein
MIAELIIVYLYLYIWFVNYCQYIHWWMQIDHSAIYSLMIRGCSEVLQFRGILLSLSLIKVIKTLSSRHQRFTGESIHAFMVHVCRCGNKNFPTRTACNKCGTRALINYKYLLLYAINASLQACIKVVIIYAPQWSPGRWVLRQQRLVKTSPSKARVSFRPTTGSVPRAFA